MKKKSNEEEGKSAVLFIFAENSDFCDFCKYTFYQLILSQFFTQSTVVKPVLLCVEPF